MNVTEIPGGTVHELPEDLRKALVAKPEALAAWNDISALARNEWICWVTSPKRASTRENHNGRTYTELAEGKRRPCCWQGCLHRTDIPLSPTKKWLLEKQLAVKK